ncbi:MAG: hypothetical protein IJ564_00705 [Alphaproteobacteria bacterium]|nr:hypothetical protein [Alphaproteobacteria bacterium]
MEKKEYRVVCSEERWTNKIFIDIAPANGVIHDMIYAARKAKNPNVSNLAGSVYLSHVDGMEPEIEFSVDGSTKKLSEAELKTKAEHLNSPENRKYGPGYAYYIGLYSKLLPKIHETYQMMRKFGKESTISVGDSFAFFDIYDMPEYARNPQEERAIEEAERFKKMQRRRQYTLERMKNDKDPVLQMKAKMKLYSGD